MDSVNKIKMPVPIVEMDGDELTRIMWDMIKKELLEPYIELNTEYYDLGLPYRDETNDQVTKDATNAIKKYGVGVKCATITPNAQRVEEYKLKSMWKSPNATIRGMLDGTVMRTPILIDSIKPSVRTWTKPITIARHAYGDVYAASEYRVTGKGKAELVFTSESGKEEYRAEVYDFECPGVLQAMYNKDTSIESFAHVCFRYALSEKIDLWFSSKDTISKQYDQTFKLIFQKIYEENYAKDFENAGIEYYYTLIDDAVARVIRSEGGMLWACKNYDGDVMSDMVSTAFGSLAMMTSVLMSPDGKFEYEAAHGTVTRHYYRYLKGETPRANPIATLFAWTGALRKRGEFDGNTELCAFADKLESASYKTLNSGIMTADLARLSEGAEFRIVDTETLLTEIRANLDV